MVRDTIAQERAAERPVDDAIAHDEGVAIEREEDALGFNGIVGRIRAALRRR